MAKIPRRVHGAGCLQAIGASLLIALVLGSFGPPLDHQRTYSSYGYTPDQGEIRRLEVEATARCRALNDNAGWIEMADGTIVCTDKRGRKQRTPVTYPWAEL